MLKVFVCDRFHQESFLNLKADSRIDLKKASKPIREEELNEAEALIIRSGTKINESLIAKAPNLKFIVSCTSGFDHIDLEACKQKNITCCFTPDANVYAASELSFNLILASIKKFQKAQELIESGVWKREHVVGTELYNKSLGIVGLGRIGSRVAKIAEGFGMKVSAFDPYVKPEENPMPFVQLIGLEELLRTSDIISIHVPFTKFTRRMFKKNQFESMNEHAILVNCSRGDVVSEAELLTALENGKFAGACLDVFEREPLITESPLLHNPKIICSPHIGGSTEESFFRGSEMAKSYLLGFFFESKMPKDTLPPNAAWYEDSFSPAKHSR